MTGSTGMAEQNASLWQAGKTPPDANVARQSGKAEHPPLRASANVGPAGRVVIPAAFRAALGLEEGAELVLSLHGEEMRMISPAAALRRAQAKVAALFPGNGSFADALIEQRKRDASVD